MLGYVYLVAIIVAMMLLTQIIFFEISRSKMKKVDNLNWFSAWNRPFKYNRVGYMIFICLFCYLMTSQEAFLSMAWVLYFALFLALGVIADMIVQYLTLVYAKVRCQNEIIEAELLKKELIEIVQNMNEDLSYEESLPQYNEIEILKKYVNTSTHLSYLTIDQGEFVRKCELFPEATFVVEPYGNVEVVKEKMSDLPVQVTQLTSSNQMPFKDERIDVVMCQNANYDKNEIKRVLKPGGYFVVNQRGSSNFSEFVQMYVPFRMRGSWDSMSCSQTLETINMNIVEKYENYGSVRFRTIQSMHSYFMKVSPDLADINKYQVFYLNALKHIKKHSYYDLTTHYFLVVAQK